MKRVKAELKRTTIPWLHEIPSYWSVAPIKYLATEKNSYFNDGDWIESKDIQSNGISYLTTGNIGPGFFKTKDSNYISEDTFNSLNCSEVFPGDILISRLNSPVGRACIVPELEHQLVTSVDNVIFRPDTKLTPAFFVFLSSSKEYFKHTADLSRGTTMQRISRSILGAIRIPLPPTGEQQKIAQFLDYETAKIDALINEQKRLIELLKEKRQAVISHAVTKGLNPDAQMKDSGVEWLGEVPEHWEVTKLGYLGDAIIGLTYSPDDIIDEGGTIVLRSTNIQNGQVSLHDNVHVSKKINEKLRLKIDDILICSRNGSRALIGKNALIGESAVGLTFGAFTTVFRSEYNSFLKYIFDSRIFSAQAGLFMTTTVNQLTTGTLNQMQIALPPVSEQNKIIEYLGSEVKRVEVLTAECELSLTLLQERRSALISAAVTGKIDVRDWQPPAGSDTVDSNASVQTERHYG